MKKIYLLIALAISLSFTINVKAQAQSITPFIVNSVGGSFTNASNSIEFSVGEVAITTIGSSGFITQGLLQAETKKINSIASVTSEQGFTLYPNPTNSSFQIDGLAKGNSYMVIIYDLTGKTIGQYRYMERQMIDISQLAASIYNITLLNMGDNKTTNFKLTKTF